MPQSFTILAMTLKRDEPLVAWSWGRIREHTVRRWIGKRRIMLRERECEGERDRKRKKS